jgi:hypothetical protein
MANSVAGDAVTRVRSGHYCIGVLNTGGLPPLTPCGMGIVRAVFRANAPLECVGVLCARVGVGPWTVFASSKYACSPGCLLAHACGVHVAIMCVRVCALSHQAAVLAPEVESSSILLAMIDGLQRRVNGLLPLKWRSRDRSLIAWTDLLAVPHVGELHASDEDWADFGELHPLTPS